MDLQKEREAFQKFCEENFDFERHEQTYFDEQTQCYENDIGEDTESINMAWMAWQAKTQAVPEGFVLVKREMQWHKADDLACLEWGRHVGLFCSENRDMSALQVEEFRLRWCKNKANKIMSDYKAMIEAQEPTND